MQTFQQNTPKDQIEYNFPIEDEASMKKTLTSLGYIIRHETKEEEKPAVSESIDNLKLSEKSRNFLKNRDIDELWKHQVAAISEAIKGKNICVTTSTSSGKTEIFQISAMELLEKNPNAKILAVYPMKALNAQQIDRWKKTGYSTGKIDGDVDINSRPDILNNSRIVVMTPDAIHAYLMGSFNNDANSPHTKAVRDFIKNIAMVVIDELHVYKGLFGSNAAYLFRRLNNLTRLLNNPRGKAIPQYITSSATLPDAAEHSSNITGAKDFIEIGKDIDGSPAAEKIFYFVEPDPEATDNSGSLDKLVYALTNVERAKSITFVDSRQKTGQVASAIENMVTADKDGSPERGIYPFKSRLEKESADEITRKMSAGKFKGIISTSALEMGLDIDGLNVAIIADMPADKNSYQQRIGRVGRFGCKKSYVIVVKNSTSVASKLLFNDPLFNIDKVLPAYEPSLYLEDPKIQSVHALCHVGDTDWMEYGQWRGNETDDKRFNHGDCFPESFVNLCQNVLQGQTDNIYEKLRPADSPQYAYSLRTFGRQYVIKPADGVNKSDIPEGVSISRRQLATEAYNGAVRFDYLRGHNIMERIIGRDSENVYVRPCRTGDPQSTESRSYRFLIPNFNKDSIVRVLKYDDETLAFNLRVVELLRISGYDEVFHKNRVYHPYPRPDNLPKLETTGTLIFHPSLNDSGVKHSEITRLLFEAFLQRNAFDRNDINYRGGRLYFSYDTFSRGDKYIAFYDENEIFNVTGRIADDAVLKDLFKYVKENLTILIETVIPDMNAQTREAILSLCETILSNRPVDDKIVVSRPREIASFSEVLFKDENDESDHICIFGGYTQDGSYCTIMIEGRRETVPIDTIYPTDNTEYLQ